MTKRTKLTPEGPRLSLRGVTPKLKNASAKPWEMIWEVLALLHRESEEQGHGLSNPTFGSFESHKSTTHIA